MAPQWDYTQQHDTLSHKDFRSLYERTNGATKEGFKEGDACLKAAISSSVLAPSGSIRISPLFLTFDNACVERAYMQILSSASSKKKDVIPFGVGCIIRIVLLCCLVQSEGDHTEAMVKDEDYLCFHLPKLSMRLVSYLWIVLVCFSILLIHFRHLSWYLRYRDTILFVAYSSMLLGEGLTIHTSHLESSVDLQFIVAQSIFMSVLHRVSFCLHLKTRVFGFGLQILGILAGGMKGNDTIRAISYLSLGHAAGVVLAYLMDQKSRIEFLLGFPRLVLNGVFRESTVYHVGVPRRALGGFAGGFAGVSSLKCSYSPSVWTVTPSDLSTEEGYGSQVTTTFTLRKEKGYYSRNLST